MTKEAKFMIIRLSEVVVELKKAPTQEKKERRQIYRGTENPSRFGSSTLLPKCLGVCYSGVVATHVLTYPVGKGWPGSPSSCHSRSNS